MPLMLTPDVDKTTPQGNDTPPPGPDRTAAQRNVRMFERVYPHRAPEAPRQGDTPARPARMPTYVALSMASIRAVQKDEFLYELWAPELQVQQLYGNQAPFMERANIVRPSSIAYGSMFALQPAYNYPYGE